MFAVSTHQQIMSLKIESQKRNEEEDQLKESEPSIKFFFLCLIKGKTGSWNE